MTPTICPPDVLALDFPAMSEHSTRPPYAVERSEYADELGLTIAERRAFNERMIAKHSMNECQAALDIALLEDLALDVAAPMSWPRRGAGHRWADKTAELRRIILARRRRLSQADVVADVMSCRRVEALEGLHWRMTIGLAWCDAFDAIANHDKCVATIRAWTWAIETHERRAADAGEPWARPDRSTAARAAWLEANPSAADGRVGLERVEQAAAIELGVAVMDRAA